MLSASVPEKSTVSDLIMPISNNIAIAKSYCFF